MSKHKICKLPEEIQLEINSFLKLKCNNCKYSFKFDEVLSGITKRTDLIIPNLPSKEYFDIKFIDGNYYCHSNCFFYYITRYLSFDSTS